MASTTLQQKEGPLHLPNHLRDPVHNVTQQNLYSCIIVFHWFLFLVGLWLEGSA